MDPKIKGIVVGVAWFLIGGGVMSVSSLTMLLIHSGGVTSPGPLFGAILFAATFGLPPVVALAGVPIAYRVYHGKPALKLALVTFAVLFVLFIASWVVPIVVRGA